ncbi:MAG TPA: hypothetical protein VF428_12920 [Casimicrobiaceae bacterium]
MNATDASALMHAVLDGEATSSEAADLERELAHRPELRAQYAALQNLFDELRRVPMGYPPEGLVASVMANIPQNRPQTADEDQLFAGPGVLGASSQGTRGRRRDGSKAARTEVQPWLRRKDEDMSEQNRTFPGKKKWWIGGGIAAAVVVIGLASGLIPPSGKDTAGTIVPAQRYQAPQSNVQDVQGGGIAGNGGQGGTLAPATDNAANASAGRSVDASAGRSVDASTGRSVDASTGRSVDASTGRSVDASTGRSVDASTGRSVDASTGRSVDASTGRSVDASTGHAVDASTGRAVNAAAGHAVDASTGRAVNAAAGHAVDASTGRAVNAAAGRAVNGAVAQ